jgi:hypothetical protein
VSDVTGVTGELAFLLVLAGLVLPCILVKLLFLVNRVEAITYTLSIVCFCKTPILLGESTMQYYVYWGFVLQVDTFTAERYSPLY